MEEKVKKLEQIVAEQKKEIFQLRSVIDNIPVSVYWKDKAGKYLDFNKTGEAGIKKFHQYLTKADIIGKTDFQIFPSEMAENFRKNDLLVINSSQALIAEEPTILINGKTAIQLSTKKPLYNEYRELIGIIGSTVDITYLKEIEAELKLANEKAEIANNLKDDFINNIQHDIRTPISGIYGLSELLARKETSSKKKIRLSYIAKASQVLLQHCNEILDFNKVQTQRLTVITRKFAILELIDMLVSLQKPVAEQKNLLFQVEINNVPNYVIGDDYRLKNILLNLVSNAFKFTTQGTIKFIAKGYKKSDQQIIIKFTVEDTGIGIAFDKQQLIMEKFIRLSPANTEQYKGLGLGMTLVKYYINELNAELNLISEESKGAKFIRTIPFNLPLLDEEL